MSCHGATKLEDFLEPCFLQLIEKKLLRSDYQGIVPVAMYFVCSIEDKCYCQFGKPTHKHYFCEPVNTTQLILMLLHSF